MKLFQKLVCMALTATATASLSICAFAADYTFDTAADTDYYPSTSYEDTYGTAYHYGSKNLVDYQIPELPYGVLSTTQTGVMEKLRLPGLQQTVGGSASGIYGVGSGVGIPAVTPVIPSYGYDLDMTQREIRYAAIPDLRTEFHPGSEIDCIVKEYHPRTGELIVSAKETEVNPFFGAEERHPVGSRRFAMISGKYGGGVFCNLPDGVTCMCNYSYQHEDADFMVGEHVMLMVQRYDQEKLQMYGKIMSKW